VSEPSLTSQIFLRNGALLIIPPLVITFSLWGALPDVFSHEQFWKGIPKWLGFLENTGRIFVFGLPGILYFGKKEVGQIFGWYLYIAGLVIYLASYLLQVFSPFSDWSQSLIGFTAPAWSTSFWFVGIGLVCKHSWLPIPWYRGIYYCTAFLFLLFHIGHTGLVYFSVVG